MKITGCRFYHVETARETGAVSEHLLVRVDTDGGVSGWGELSDMHHIHPAEFPSIAVMEEEANLRIDGCDPFQMGAALERMGPVAYPAFDLALYDLLGKLLDTPVYTLIGGKRRDRIPFCYPIFTLSTPAGEDAGAEIERQLQHVRRVVDLGQNRIRKYIGHNLDAEEQWLKAFQEAFGDTVEIKSLDLSGRFFWQEALAVLQRFRPYRYQVAESVSRRKPGRDLPDRLDLRGMAEVRRQLGLPISEHANSLHLIRRLHDANAIDVVNHRHLRQRYLEDAPAFRFRRRVGPAHAARHHAGTEHRHSRRRPRHGEPAQHRHALRPRRPAALHGRLYGGPRAL